MEENKTLTIESARNQEIRELRTMSENATVLFLLSGAGYFVSALIFRNCWHIAGWVVGSIVMLVWIYIGYIKIRSLILLHFKYKEPIF